MEAVPKIDHLSQEELEIEFLVRHIRGSLDEKRKELLIQLDAEADGVPPPNHPHEAAYRNPKVKCGCFIG